MPCLPRPSGTAWSRRTHSHSHGALGHPGEVGLFHVQRGHWRWQRFHRGKSVGLLARGKSSFGLFLDLPHFQIAKVISVESRLPHRRGTTTLLSGTVFRTPLVVSLLCPVPSPGLSEGRRNSRAVPGCGKSGFGVLPKLCCLFQRACAAQRRKPVGVSSIVCCQRPRSVVPKHGTVSPVGTPPPKINQSSLQTC